RDELGRLVRDWQAKRAYLIGSADKLMDALADVSTAELPDETAVAAESARRLGTTNTLVVTNPVDGKEGRPSLSGLAPWIALRKRAALLLTNATGDNVEEIVASALRRESQRQADTLLLVGDLEAIPMRHRPNPIPGDKDSHIEMEPLTPAGSEPFT